MPASVWQAIFSILSALWSVEGPTVKAALIAELQSIAAKYSGNIAVDALVAEAEKLVAAA